VRVGQMALGHNRSRFRPVAQLMVAPSQAAQRQPRATRVLNLTQITVPVRVRVQVLRVPLPQVARVLFNGGGGSGGYKKTGGSTTGGAGNDGIIVIIYTPAAGGGKSGTRTIIFGKLKINNGGKLKVLQSR
jgi:hypothetical protein